MKKNKIAFIPLLGVKGLLTWLLLLMLAVSACKKKNADPEPDLPPETQIGADTFGCYINGVPWKAQGDGGWGRSLITLDQSGGNGWFVLIGNDFTKKEWIKLFHINILGTGKYSLGKNTMGGIGYYTQNGYFMSSDATEFSAELTITRFDTLARIFSGRFWFKMTMPDGKIIDVTSGRFDIKLL